VLNAAIDQVAEALGNTRAVCRKAYVHPHVFDAFSDGTLGKALARGCKPVRGLDEAETAVLTFLCNGVRGRRPARAAALRRPGIVASTRPGRHAPARKSRRGA
jgi:DNA topoisomerase IB